MRDKRRRLELLRGSYNSVDMSEYKREFSFLNIPDMPQLSEVKNKQRYIFAYRLFQFMASSLAVLIVNFFAVLSLVLINERHLHGVRRCEVFLRYLWPWSGSQAFRFSQLDATGSPLRVAESGQSTFLLACGAVSGLWLAWAAYRVYVLIAQDNTYDFSLGGIVVLCLGSIFLWWASSDNLFEYNSFGPSIYDSVTVFTLKKAAIISASYWMSGFLIFASSAKIRYATQIEGG